MSNPFTNRMKVELIRYVRDRFDSKYKYIYEKQYMTYWEAEDDIKEIYNILNEKYHHRMKYYDYSSIKNLIGYYLAESLDRIAARNDEYKDWKYNHITFVPLYEKNKIRWVSRSGLFMHYVEDIYRVFDMDYPIRSKISFCRFLIEKRMIRKMKKSVMRYENDEKYRNKINILCSTDKYQDKFKYKGYKYTLKDGIRFCDEYVEAWTKIIAWANILIISDGLIVIPIVFVFWLIIVLIIGLIGRRSLCRLGKD